MSADGFVQVPPDSTGTGQKIDVASVGVAGVTVMRQRVVIGDNSASAQFALVTGGALLVQPNAVAISGTALVAFASQPPVAISGTALVSVTNTVTVTGGVAVSGGVQLAAGTANIGTLNDISRTVQVQIQTPFTVNNISATVNTQTVIANFLAGSGQVVNLVDTANTALRVNVIAGTGSGANPVSIAAGTSNIGFINNISATVTTVVTNFAAPSGQQINVIDSANTAIRVNVVAGSGSGANPVSIAAGTSNIGFINNISATVIVAGVVSLGAGTNLIGAVSLAAGTSNIGTINNISAAVVLAAGTSNIGTINNISAAVVLAAGTANIGTINNISANVSVLNVAGTALIGAVSLGAGTANIGFINGISANVNVVNLAGTNNIGGVSLVAGTSNIGFINNISATVTVAISNFVDSSGNNRNVIDSVNTALRVNIVAGAASGVSQIDDTTFSTGAATFAPIGAVWSDTGTGQSLSASHAGVLRMTAFRALHTNIRNSAGVEMGTPTSPFSVKVEQVSAAVVLAAGTANIGRINDISATVNVAIMAFKDSGGNVVSCVDSVNAALRVIGAGLGNSLTIGNWIDASGTSRNLMDSSNLALRVTIANATATVAITCATPFTVNNISRTVSVVCATPFIIDGISATVTVTTANPYVLNTPSASHGPRMIQVSTSATATFVAAPGAGLHIYVTQVAVSNAGTNLTGCQIGLSATLGMITMVAAANGGGFVMNFDPPVKCYSNEALLCRVDPNPGGNVFFNVNYYVAA